MPYVVSLLVCCIYVVATVDIASVIIDACTASQERGLILVSYLRQLAATQNFRLKT